MNASTSDGGKAKMDQEEKALATDIAALRRDLKMLADDVARLGKAGVEEMTGRARAKAAEATQAGSAFAADVRSELDDFNQQVATATRENPWRALGIAALAGILFGLLIRR